MPSTPVMYLMPSELIQDTVSVNCIPPAVSNIVYIISEMNNDIADVTSATTRAIAARFDKIPITAPIKGSRIIRVINILHHPPDLHNQNQYGGSEYVYCFVFLYHTCLYLSYYLAKIDKRIAYEINYAVYEMAVRDISKHCHWICPVSYTHLRAHE